MARSRFRTTVFVFLGLAFPSMVAKQAEATEPGPDVNVSVAAANGTDDYIGHEAEMMIDVNPTNSDHMVIVCHGNVNDVDPDVGWGNDYPAFINFFFTTDGGINWTRIPIGSALDGINVDRDPNDPANPEDTRTDPVVAFADDGTLYIGYITFPDYYRESMNKQIVIARGTYSESAQTYLFDHFREVGVRANLDKVQIATGPDPEFPDVDVVYVTWWEVSQIKVAHSTDSGYSWSISPNVVGNTDFHDSTFNDPAVGPDGTLYVAWQQGSVIKVAVDYDDRGDNFNATMNAATGINPNVA